MIGRDDCLREGPILCRVGRKLWLNQSTNQHCFTIYKVFYSSIPTSYFACINIQKITSRRGEWFFEADWSERLTNETIGTSLDAVVGAVPGCGGDLPVVRYRTSRRCCRLIHSKFFVCCGCRIMRCSGDQLWRVRSDDLEPLNGTRPTVTVIDASRKAAHSYAKI